MKRSMMKLNVGFALMLGIITLAVGQNNAPSADDMLIEINDVAATEIILNGMDVDDDVLYFPVVERPLHGVLTSAEDTLITGTISNLEAGPFSVMYWMFDQDGSPFIEDGNLNSVYAYTHLNWNEDAHGDGSCESGGSGFQTIAVSHTENLAVIDGVAGVSMFLDNLDILSQTHVNTENPADAWTTLGEAGEIRIYNQGNGGIKEDGVVKLAVENLTLWLKIYYPGPVGAGGANGYASGFGVAHIDQATSDPAWVSEFDPENTGLVEVAFESFSQTVQNCYGTYDIVNMSIQPISDAVLSYIPFPDYHGSDRFSYVVFDGEDFSDEIQVTLDINTGSPDIDGDGSEEAPFQIEVLDDLLWLSNHSDYWDAHFIQIANIDATPTADWNAGQGFRAIGTEDNNFTGSYDGQGFTIDGLTINRPNSDYQGLFGYAGGSNLDNIGLTNVSIVGAHEVGGLAGRSRSVVNYCYTTGVITGMDKVGGLVGYNQEGIYGSYSTCTVTGAGEVGGLVGLSMTIGYGVHNSYSTGSVAGLDLVGGFVGNAFSTIENCYSRGNVTRTGDVSERLGGFTGGTNANHVIRNSYATGSVAYQGAADPMDKGFVGNDENGILLNNFFDMESSGQVSGIGAAATSTSDMKTVDTFLEVGWDFEIETINGDDDDWDMDNVNGVLNDGYPVLSWVNGPEIALDAGTAPVVDDLVISTFMNESVEFILQGHDADDDELSYNLWTWGVMGTLELVDSTVTYTPPADIIGSDAISYVAHDAFYESNVGAITVNIYLPNSAPVLTAIGPQTTNEDTALVLVLDASDADDDNLSFQAVAADTAVSVTLDANVLTLTPAANWNGSTEILVTVTDDGSGNLSDSETFIFTVNPVDDAPEVFALLLPEDNYEAVDSMLTFSWEASTDVDSDNIYYMLHIYNASYDQTFDAGTNLSFSSSVLDMPRDVMLAWSVAVSDSVTAVWSATRLFTVAASVGQNMAPVANDTTVEILEDATAVFVLSGTDAENDELIFTILDNPGHGVVNSVNDTVTYTPLSDYNGLDTLVFTVSDAENSDTGYVYIEIEAVNDAPAAFVLVAPEDNMNILDSLITLSWEASYDVDGDDIYYVVHTYANGYAQNYDAGHDLSLTISTLNIPRDLSISWMVEANDSSLATPSNSYHFTVDQTVGIAAVAGPVSWNLRQNYPNPFNPSTTISFSVPETSVISLIIYDLSGREIRSLVKETESQGDYAVVWDGTDNSGNIVSSGMYVYRLQGGNFAQIRRMLYLK